MNAMILFAQAAQEAAKPTAQQGGGMGMLVPMLLIFAIFYFMMIRPQQRKEKERRKMIEELRAGARVVFAGGFLGTIIEDSKTPKKGYYEYKGTPYYYTGGAWYTPGDDGEWERDYNAPDRLEENYNDYFEAKDYSSLDSDYAGEVEEYPTEAYSNDSYDNDDSWNDSNWDDDDWDYDYDSYDSYDSDWDSDW